MGVEIERKFLVKDDSWRGEVRSCLECRQGYLASERERTVRVRILGDQGFITVKGESISFSRAEFEYEIPKNDARELLLLCENVVEKTRHFIEFDSFTWELDVFEGSNNGLVMAEIELGSESELFGRPEWLGAEVTGDSRYYNSKLAVNPFSNW